jgi:hypothetical protein
VTDGIIPGMRRGFTKMASLEGALARRVVEFATANSRPVSTGVTDGTRTRNSQNHNLELYH